MIKAGIVVGEVSGDTLASALVLALKEIYPDFSYQGVLGPKLIELGGQALYPMERLCLMGFIEPLFRLPSLYWMRRQLIDHFTRSKPNVFIGVDAPDFNLGLEQKLKERSLKTVHYVSPTVWAWRQSRIHTIKKAVDLMLALYPFEQAFYQKHRVPVCFIGHPLADQIPLAIDSKAAKQTFGLSETQKIVALLPGSRNSELRYMARQYIEVAKWCYERDKTLQFMVPLVSLAHQKLFDTLCLHYAPDLPIRTFVGQSRQVISCADAVLVTSGTATLEVLLHKKPMVVAYRMHPLTYQLAKRLVKIPYISQPNILANENLVPEFIQDAVTTQNLGEALLARLEPNAAQEKLSARFLEIHESLRLNAAKKAAHAIADLIS